MNGPSTRSGDTGAHGWFASGMPWVWLTAGAVSVSLIMVFGYPKTEYLRPVGRLGPKVTWL